MSDVAAGIIERFRRYGWSTPEGEWGALYSDHRGALRDALESGDVAALDDLLAGSFFDMCGGLLSTQELVADHIRGILETWAVSTAPLANLTSRPSSPVARGDASMLPIRWGNRVVNTLDAPRHDHYAVQIMRYLPSGGTMMEVGCGIGGVARQLWARKAPVRVVLCDMPETLYLTWYYLSAITDLRVGWWDDDGPLDVVLLPDSCLHQWTGRPDLILAAHSLSEMPMDVARGYLSWADEHGVRYIYSDNAAWVTPSPEGKVNSCVSFPEVLLADLVPPGPYAERWRRQIPWDLPKTRYVEVFYERVEP